MIRPNLSKIDSSEYQDTINQDNSAIITTSLVPDKFDRGDYKPRQDSNGEDFEIPGTGQNFRFRMNSVAPMDINRQSYNNLDFGVSGDSLGLNGITRNARDSK